ncbi:MAG: beta-ketoacyl synthase chain length factor [Tannerella sp.]|jgi:3-oxoacyl-(acyl-carrier-protein) synthase|nr:beta-ketoacyl synthase chain length factor [Tannerella sp.]
MFKPVYISTAKQISAQSPLSDDWMEHPLLYGESFVPAVDPDYRQYFPPNTVRRQGKILKRALLVSRQVTDAAGTDSPDAIITGTGFGCIENTKIFLDALLKEGETFLKPTHFMQSTHNTVSSLIAIDCRCHGYNMTYSHKAISFECALLDAFIRLKNGEAANVLAGGHDELTPHFHTLLQRLERLEAGTAFRSETAVGMILTNRPARHALCRLDGVETFYRPDGQQLKQALDRMLAYAGYRYDEIDAIMTGCNGMPADRQAYDCRCAKLFPDKKRLRYKHLSGDSFTSSAMGVYIAATCLHRRQIPAHLCEEQTHAAQDGAKCLLLYHLSENKTHSLILLSSCGN